MRSHKSCVIRAESILHVTKSLHMLYTGVEVMATIDVFVGKIDRSRRNMEIYKWKWMVLGALGCINNADLKKNKRK